MSCRDGRFQLHACSDIPMSRRRAKRIPASFSPGASSHWRAWAYGLRPASPHSMCRSKPACAPLATDCRRIWMCRCQSSSKLFSGIFAPQKSTDAPIPNAKPFWRPCCGRLIDIYYPRARFTLRQMAGWPLAFATLAEAGGKSGLHGNTVPDNVRRRRLQGKRNRKQTAVGFRSGQG